MNCPDCGAASRVILTRHIANNRTRRRHECNGPVKHRFTTIEEIAANKPPVPAKAKPLNIGNLWGPPT